MPNDYVEDYEEVTGKKREDASVTAKVVTASASKADAQTTDAAETKEA
jgi:hypothetical protein